MDLMGPYLNRKNLADALVSAVRQLQEEQAQTGEPVFSMRSTQSPSQWRVGDRLSEVDTERLVAAFNAGNARSMAARRGAPAAPHPPRASLSPGHRHRLPRVRRQGGTDPDVHAGYPGHYRPVLFRVAGARRPRADRRRAPPARLSADALTSALSVVRARARTRRIRLRPTPRERQLMALVARGCSHKEAAAQMSITALTVAGYLKSIKIKYLASHPDIPESIAPLTAACGWAKEIGTDHWHG